MIRKLLKSVREYKHASIKAPVYVSLEVVMECVIPLIMASLIVGALFAFSFSMLEVSDSLILAQKSEFYPITKAIFELSQIIN